MTSGSCHGNCIRRTSALDHSCEIYGACVLQTAIYMSSQRYTALINLFLFSISCLVSFARKCDIMLNLPLYSHCVYCIQNNSYDIALLGPNSIEYYLVVSSGLDKMNEVI